MRRARKNFICTEEDSEMNESEINENKINIAIMMISFFKEFILR